MKVERAGTLDDFKKLRQPYLEAVLKSKGREMARSLRDRGSAGIRPVIAHKRKSNKEASF
jgi:hypothetical protein